LAERGYFARELNTGWAEWSEAKLPTHAEEHLGRDAIRCGCSLHADLVPRELTDEDAARPAPP
jgi:hypothetical protein